MEGTRIPAPSVAVIDRYGRQAEGTLTREEWLDHETDSTIEVVRYHRDLVGQAA